MRLPVTWRGIEILCSCAPPTPHLQHSTSRSTIIDQRHFDPVNASDRRQRRLDSFPESLRSLRRRESKVEVISGRVARRSPAAQEERERGTSERALDTVDCD